MDGFKGGYTTREYTCDNCKTRVRVTNIPMRPLGSAKYEVYCPRCKTQLGDDISYTPGDMPPRMEVL